MIRARMAAAGALAFLGTAVPAQAAGDPVMPLSEVRAGMQCTAYSVVRGVAIDRFDAEVLDVVDDSTGTGARILLEVSGPAVDRTGIGPGFSGSPVYCPGPGNVPHVVGAISEGIGEYGGKVVLAMPIEEILAESADPPSEAPPRASGGRAVRSLTAPLSVSGLSPALGRALSAAARRAGRPLLVAPRSPANRYPPQRLRPGSAFGVGYASGDLSLSSVGTIAYVDGDRVWGFGHPFEGAGRRSLLLQDAYVYRVIANPNTGGEAGGTYKLAASGHDVGTLSNDALAAVVGRMGGLPDVIPVSVSLHDEDTGATRAVSVRVADEADLGQPVGASAIGFVAPLAVTQGATALLRSSPVRSSGAMCARIGLRERRRPLRLCNRYVGQGGGEVLDGNAVASGAAADLLEALTAIESYRFGDLHVTGVQVNLRIARGARQAYLRDVSLPRRVRRGSTVTVRATIQRLRSSRRERVSFRMRVPGTAPKGRRSFTLTGTDSDAGGGDLFGDLATILSFDEEDAEADDGGGDGGHTSVAAVVRAVERVERYDGVVARFGRERIPRRALERRHGRLPANGRPVLRRDDVRISGRARTTVRVLPAR